MRRTLSLAMLMSLATASPAVQALGLADPRVQSSLNEPLHARIDVVDLQGLDPALLQVRLADEAAFERAGLPRSTLAESVHLALQRDGGGLELVLTTERAVREPFLDLLVTLAWPGGRQRQQVTLLLDPPGYASAPALLDDTPGESAAPRPVRVATVTPAEARPAPVAAAVMPSRPEAPSRQIRVQPGDTLWELANRVRPDADVSIDQAMLALLRANPQAFPDGNINGLRAGAVLDVPPRQAMLASTPAEAGDRVEAQNQAWRGAADEVPAVAANVAADIDEPRAVAEADTPTVVVPRLTLLSDADLAAERAAQAATSTDTDPLAERLATLATQWRASRETLNQVREERDRLEGEIAALREDIAELREMLVASVQAQAQTPASEAEAQSPAEPVSAAEPQTPRIATAIPTSDTSPDDGGRGGLWRVLSDNLLALAGAAIALLLALWLWVRRRQAGAEQPMIDFPSAAVAAGAAPMASVSPAPADSDAASAASTGGPRPAVAPASAPQAETISEADIFIAYGRHDQARELLRQGLEYDPARHDLRLKLLAVLVELGEHEAARSEAAHLEALDDPDYRQEAQRLLSRLDDAHEPRDESRGAQDEIASAFSSEHPEADPAHEADATPPASSGPADDAPAQEASWRQEPAPQNVPVEIELEASDDEAPDAAAEPNKEFVMPSEAFIEYEPPRLDPAPERSAGHDETPRQPSVDYPGRLDRANEADASDDGDELDIAFESDANISPRTVIGHDWEIEEVAFEPLNLDNEQPAAGASPTSPELLERARQRLDDGEPDAARELLHTLLERDDTQIVQEARLLIERHNLY